jgi:6-phosphogluconolactonase (cycloisomerase 2 family)
MTSKQWMLALAVWLPGCGSSSPPEADHSSDAGGQDAALAVDGTMAETGAADTSSAVDAGVDASADASAADASPTAFSLLVTETPPGSPAMSSWEGVLRFTLAADGAQLVSVPGIDAGEVADPLSLGFRATSSELFIGNRHGNQTDEGSISRFVYDPNTGALSPSGTITGNGLSGVSQIVFHPITGEMFVADYNGASAISRFTFDDAGVASANGTLGTGATQGLSFTPDGTLLFATSGGAGGNTIRQYNLADGGVSTAATVAGAPRLFFLAIRDSELYVGAVDVNAVYRLTIGAANQLTALDSVAADGALAVAFSPDGQQMFTSGHLTSNLIDTFSYNASSDTWTKTAIVTTPSSLSGIVVLQGGAGLPAIDAGAVEAIVPLDGGSE